MIDAERLRRVLRLRRVEAHRAAGQAAAVRTALTTVDSQQERLRAAIPSVVTAGPQAGALFASRAALSDRLGEAVRSLDGTRARLSERAAHTAAVANAATVRRDRLIERARDADNAQEERRRDALLSSLPPRRSRGRIG